MPSSMCCDVMILTPADAYVATDGNTTRTVHEALLPDPRIVADFQQVYVVAFQNRLMTDVNVLSKPDVLTMENHYARFEHNVRADFAKMCFHR